MSFALATLEQSILGAEYYEHPRYQQFQQAIPHLPSHEAVNLNPNTVALIIERLKQMNLTALEKQAFADIISYYYYGKKIGMVMDRLIVVQKQEPVDKEEEKLLQLLKKRLEQQQQKFRREFLAQKVSIEPEYIIAKNAARDLISRDTSIPALMFFLDSLSEAKDTMI